MRDTLALDGYQNLQVVARGVDTTLFHPGKRSDELRSQWGVAEDGLAVIYVGRISAEKNLPLVLRTFKAMQAVNPKLKLVMVGDGPVRAELQRQNPEYIFAGMRTGEDLAAHYASGDIFLFPSMTETYGNVTVEAMASGLAVVAYRLRGSGRAYRATTRTACTPSSAMRMNSSSRHADWPTMRRASKRCAGCRTRPC